MKIENAVLINVITKINGIPRTDSEKKTNTRRAGKARWKRKIIWM